MRYGFTATRDLIPQHTRTILDLLEELTDGTHFRTGAARGGDTFIARALVQLYPRAVHELVVPDGPHNDELVDGWMPNGRTRLITRMPPGSTYADRNFRLVTMDDRMVAFPRLEEHRQPRSGTWQTVRMARKTGKLYRLVVLEPDEGFEASQHRSIRPAKGRNRGAPLAG